MEIREIKIKDIDSFLKLFTESVKNQFSEYSKKSKQFFLEEEWTKKRIRDSLKGKQVVYLLALNKDVIVGYLIGTFPFAGVATIMWLAISDDCQRKGVGTKLINKFSAISKKNKAHKIDLTVTNKINLAFYKKNGFKYGCLIKKYYFGLDAYLLFKQIQEPKW